MKILCIFMFCMLLLSAGCGELQESESIASTKVERSEIAMNTIVTLKAEGVNAKIAVDSSFDEVAAIEERICEDENNLELHAGDDEYVAISEDTYNILKAAQKYSELTGGAFDVTIGAAVELWNIGSDNPRVPTIDEVESVKQVVGHEHLHLRDEDHSAKLDLKGVKLDLGGIAKGYAVDRVREKFAVNEITDGLIDFGTSTIYAIGKKRIGLKDPRRPSDIAKVIEIKNSAISTSGDYEKYFVVDGKRYHHIIDPRSCAPAEVSAASVSVIVEGGEADSAMIADILSTASFILGQEAAANLPPSDKQIIILTGD